MNIGIVGFGVVGKALSIAFQEKAHRIYLNELNVEHTHSFYSKKSLLKFCEIIFICVQTPTLPDGKQDLSHLKAVLESFRSIYRDYVELNPLFVIKSTVLPNTTAELQSTFRNLRIVVNPEFLREKTAVDDARNPDRIVIGTPSEDDARLLWEFYKDWECPKFWYPNPTDAELVKYLSNAFLVTKVAFSCEMLAVCSAFGCSPLAVLQGLRADHRINKSHLNPIGKIPRNSPCLPKDVKALIHALRKKGFKNSLIEHVYKFGVEQ